MKETRIIEKILPSGKTRIVTQVVVPTASPDVDTDDQANLEISEVEETLHQKYRKHPNPYKTVKVDIVESSSLSESTMSYNDAL